LKYFFYLVLIAHLPSDYYKQPTMNATTITSNAPEKITIKVKKPRAPYGSRKLKLLVLEEDPEPEPVVQEPTPVDEFLLTEEDLIEGARLVAEAEKGDDDEEETKSLSSIEEEEETKSEEGSESEEEEETKSEEEEETKSEEGSTTENVVITAEEAEEAEEEELSLPTLESDPIVLREQILNLQAEVIRLTKFNQDLQRRLEGERKQPKKKTEKQKKEKDANKRTNKRDKRPSDYADKFLTKGQVLRWTHKARKAWGEATYIGNNAFTARFSFKPEGEFPEEFPSLNAVAGVMLKHLTLRTVNAWAVFKTPDGKSVENLDLVAKKAEA